MAMEAVVDPHYINKVKRIKDYAFVTFNDHENAKKCLEYWNGK